MLPVNLFDNDNGIIDNQSHRSGHRTERHDIDGDSCQITEQDAESHRNGDGQHHHQTRPPGAKKQHHHDDGEEQSLVDGFQYAVDAVAYEGTLIVIGLEFIACRKLLPYLVRLAFHLLREIDQIHARLLHQIDKYGIIAISIDFQKLLLFLYLDSRYIAQTDNALAVVADNHIPQFFHVVDTCIGQRQIQAVIIRHVAVSQYIIRLCESGLYLCGSNAERRHLRGIGLHDELLRLAAAYHYIADTIYLREHGTYHEVAHIAQDNAAVCLALQRESIDREQRLVHRLGGDDRTVGQKSLYLIDTALQLGFQSIDIQSPLEVNVYHATAPAGAALDDRRTLHLLHRAFQGFGDGNHHTVYGLLSGIGYHRDAGEQHFGKQVGLHLRVAPRSGKQQKQPYEQDRAAV